MGGDTGISGMCCGIFVFLYVTQNRVRFHFFGQMFVSFFFFFALLIQPECTTELAHNEDVIY